MKKGTVSKKAVSLFMSAAMVVAFAPAVVAPQQALAWTSEDIANAEAYVDNAGSNGANALTLDAAKKVVSYSQNELVDKIKKGTLSEDAKAIILIAQQAVKEIPEAQAQLNAVTVNRLAASADMQRSNLTWTTTNPQKTKGIFYEIAYKPKGNVVWLKSTTPAKRNGKGYYYYGVENLKANTNYLFKVRAAKKIYGETVYGPWTKNVTRKVLKKYETGDYKASSKVKVRKSTSTKAKVVKTIKKNTKVKVTKIQIKNAKVWGKLKFEADVRVTSGLKYQVRYRKTEDDEWTYKTYSSKKKANAAISKYKKKGNAVRVRAYKKISGKVKYGSWSKTTTGTKLYAPKTYKGWAQMSSFTATK